MICVSLLTITFSICIIPTLLAIVHKGPFNVIKLVFIVLLLEGLDTTLLREMCRISAARVKGDVK